MRKNNPETDNNDDLSSLTELKLSFVLRDYQSYYEVSSRELSRIMTLKGWEITLVSGLMIVLISKPPVPLLAALPIYLIVCMFLLLECQIHASLVLIDHDVV